MRVLKNTLAVVVLLTIGVLMTWPAAAIAGELSEWIDRTVPVGLTLVGVAVGCPVLIVIARLWGRAKPARLLDEIITSTQKARRSMRETDNAALDVMDTALKRAMPPSARMAIRAIKDKIGLKSAKRG